MHVQSRVVFGNQRISRVAEDRFDEVEIADQRAGCEESGFHRFGFAEIREHSGQTSGRSSSETQVWAGCSESRRVRQQHQIARRIHRSAKQIDKDCFGDDAFVAGNRQSAIDDVKRAGGRAAVSTGIVQYAIQTAIRLDQIVLELVAVGTASSVRGPSRAGRASASDWALAAVIVQHIMAKYTVQKRFDPRINRGSMFR